MIKCVGRIDVPLDLVKAMFADVGSWPQWMPGVLSVDLLQESGNTKRFELKQRQGGRELTQEMEVRLDSGGMKLHQVKGRFKKWEAHWRFLLPPDKDGTTLSATLELELGGILGAFVPPRMIRGGVDRMFENMMKAAQRRARRLSAERGRETGVEGEILLEVFQTTGGLEVWIGGRKYLLPDAD